MSERTGAKAVSTDVLAMLEDVVGKLSDAVLLMDENWRIVYANAMSRRLSRILPEHLNSRTLWELYPETVGSDFERACREAAQAGEERRVADYYYEPFKIWVDIRAIPTATGVALYYRDTTELHEAQAERDLTAEQLSQVLNATTDGVVMIDRAWRFSFLNQKAQQLLSMSDRELLGKDIWESFPAMVYEGSPFVEHYRHAMNDGRAGEFEAHYPAPLNMWIHVFARPARDGIIVFFRDVTASRRAADARRESEERLSAIFSGTFEYIGLLSPDGTMLDCNRSALQFAGNKLEDVVGKKFWDCPWWIYTPGAADVLKLWIERAARGEFIRQQVPLMKPNSEVITFDFSLHPIRDEHGNVVLLVPEGRDITDLKRAEGALMQSEKLAAVGRLASSIAHEINNPLEAVMNVVYLAGMQAASEEQRSLLKLADQELKRVANITHQTLRFHKQASNPQSVTCEELLASVLSIYGGRLRNSSIVIEKRLYAPNPVTCFEGDIRQVLNNLVDNAIDAMPLGGKLMLRSREGTDWTTGRYGVVMTVADTGSGIDPLALEKVFEPFFTTKGISGTGLGLWISSEIMQRHGGRLRLRSSQDARNHGTVVSLFLPMTP